MGRPRRVLTPDLPPARLWGSQLRALRDVRGLSLPALGDLVRYDPGYLGSIERGDQFATLTVAKACDLVLNAGGDLVRLWQAADHEHGSGHVLDDRERRLVAKMPLHAVTSIYGEAGLRARFAVEAGRLLDDVGRENAARALDLAARLHAGDRRQREPYINHLLRVAVRIMCHYEVGDPEVICAALLHDAVEDHGEDLAAAGRDGAAAALAASFGPRVADLVSAVTNPGYQPGVGRHEQYRAHLAAVLDGNPWARVLKVSDFTDNGVGLIYTTGPKTVKLAGKYAPLVPVLSGLIARPDTPLPAYVKERILGQLCDAQERFEAIAAGA